MMDVHQKNLQTCGANNYQNFQKKGASSCGKKAIPNYTKTLLKEVGGPLQPEKHTLSKQVYQKYKTLKPSA